MTKELIEAAFLDLQDDIIRSLEAADGKGKFRVDRWEHKDGGGGRSCIIEKGNVIEKGGVNFSAVKGKLSEKMSRALEIDAGEFFATGVSIVLHPENPHVPIIHMNIRYFEMHNGEYWFGGGIDLTPHFIVPSQATYFHQGLKNVCDEHDSSFYPRFKTWADNYFYIPHREETRGVGGIFFDRLNEKTTQHTKDELFAFVIAVGRSFAPLYTHFMKDSSSKSWSEHEKKWQLLRRGRYVEFNLVYDRGTKFGLETGGRIESILMSLPQHASWEYNFTPEKESAEAFTLRHLKKDIDWLASDLTEGR